MMSTETKEITNSDDVIDVRDITERVEYLESLRDDPDEEFDLGDDNGQELLALTDLLEDLKDAGDGNHDWRDSWYPLILVRDSYFQQFAQDEAESLDLVKSDARWPYTCIDWEQAAEQLQQDYTTVEFDGVTYWYR